MKHMKGSILVFAVAAAFAGSVVAAEDLDDCRDLNVGFTTYQMNGMSGNKQNPQDTTIQAGAWKVVGEQQGAFKSSNILYSGCAVPKGKRAVVTVWGTTDGSMTADQCALYNTLASVDGKLASGTKLGEAYMTLEDAIVSKLPKLVNQGKLTGDGQSAIEGALKDAQACIKLFM